MSTQPPAALRVAASGSGGGAGSGAAAAGAGHGPPAAGASPASILARGRRTSKADHIKWDEVVIAEHDKERGTRMPIIEPKTPYHASRRPDGALSDDDASDGSPVAAGPSLAAQWDEMQARVAVGGDDRTADRAEADAWDAAAARGGSADAASRGDAAAKHAAFEAHRKAHYGNEAEAMRRARALLAADDDDDDDGAGGDLAM